MNAEPTNEDVEKQVEAWDGLDVYSIVEIYLRKVAAMAGELAEVNKNAKYWLEQHGIECEKRGQAEHELDLARGNLSESFELLERERDEARAAIALAREAMTAWLDLGDVHEPDCPCDDTCDCKVAAMVNKALLPTIGSDIVAENRRMGEALTQLANAAAMVSGQLVLVEGGPLATANGLLMAEIRRVKEVLKGE